mgnify:FL=1
MKSLVSALVLIGLLSTTVLAKDVDYVACTADHLTAVLSVVLSDVALADQPGIEQRIGLAFRRTAASLPAEVLVSAEGYQAFVNQLAADAVAAMQILGPPAITNVACFADDRTQEARYSH